MMYQRIRSILAGNGSSKRTLLIGIVAFGVFLGGSLFAARVVAQDDGPACIVATWGEGEVLRVADVETLRAQASPAPTGAAARQWALDVSLAAWEADKSDASPREKIGVYKAWVAEAAGGPGIHGKPRAIRDASTTLRTRANLDPGPCYD